MSKLPFAAGSIQAEGALYQDPKVISGDNSKTTTVSLKVKLNYRERDDDDLDTFFVDVYVFGSLADNIVASGWKKFDRIVFGGKFKGRRWTRNVSEQDGGGKNEEQSIVVNADFVGAIPRFVEVSIAESDYDGNNSGGNSGGGSSRRSNSNSDEEAPRSSGRTRSRGRDDDDSSGSDAPSERSSRRSAPSSDDDEQEPPRSTRRASGRSRARDSNYED